MEIAIVEDCVMTRFIHTTLIKNLNKDFNVQNFNCGEEFLEALKSKQIETPDLVITDYNMKQLTGIDLINELDDYRNLKQIKDKLFVYLVSANTNLENSLKEINNDTYQGFIPKPLNENNVIDILSEQGYGNFQNAI